MRSRIALLGLAAAAPPTAWFATQQAAGTLSYFACAAAGPPVGLAIGLAGIAACLAAAALAWRRLGEGPDDLFAAQVAVGLAAIFGLTNLITVAAIALIPPCAS